MSQMPAGQPKGADTNKQVSRDTQVRQCVENQRVMRQIIDDPDTKPLEAAACVRAWDAMSERLRILRGKPLPGQLQPDKQPKRRSSRRVIGLATPEQIAQQIAGESAA